jgi:serine-type D-Ala-D-Ala carboxypeptidase (penicillin-binding protein 5/6)
MKKRSKQILIGSVFLIALYLIIKVEAPSQEPEIVQDVPAQPIQEIEAKAVLSVFVSPSDDRIIYQKNSDIELPMASVTKLMTALIVVEQYDLEETITITEEAFSRDLFRKDNLNVGEQYQTKTLLYPLLIESNNTAAYALAQKLDETTQSFVDSMNQKAQELGMEKTFFINPSGLDPINTNDVTGLSTAEDIVVLAKRILKEPLIQEILSLTEYDLKTIDGTSKYTVLNTNVLLGEKNVLWGKTGETPRAKGCLVLVLDSSCENSSEKCRLINVVLGSENRFQEMKNLIDWF